MEICIRWFRKTGVVEITKNGETVTHKLSLPGILTVRAWIVGLQARYGEDMVILERGSAVLHGPAAHKLLRMFRHKFCV